MLKYIKNQLKKTENKKLISNFFSLSILQVLTYILPLLTLPYLVRVLGINNFGLVAFYAALSTYFQIIVDFGFNYTATREIALQRDNKNKLLEIYSSVLSIKVVLFISSALLLGILLIFVEKFNRDWEIFLLTFGGVFGQMLFPVWFFQGLEKMKYITYLNIIARTVFTIAIFIFIRQPSDYFLVPLINSFGLVIIGIWSILIVRFKFDVKFSFQPIQTIILYFKDAWYIFISNLAVTLYTSTTMVLLGFFTNNIIVGYYATADKLISALKGLIVPISQALFPFINRVAYNSKIKALSLLKKMVLLLGGGMLITSIILFVSAKLIILKLFGEDSINSIPILQIFSIVPFLVTLDTIFGTLNMLVFKKNKEYSKIIISAGLINVIIAFILIPLYKDIGAAISVLIVELYITSRLFIFIQKNELKIF